MRYLFIYILFILISSTVASQTTINNFTLQAPSQINNETLQDFLTLLKQGTENSWQLKSPEQTIKPGILLNLSNNPDFKTKETFRIQSNGKDQLIITSSSPEGLVFGFYKHLRSLGFKFYLPDELYTLIPKLKHPFGTKKDIIDQPFLQIRDFFGTGGFGSSNSDADKKVEKDWTRWQLRNGFGAAYQLAGHRGENFILENYPLLQKNPQWLASPLTGDKHKDQNIKLNYANKDALNFYIDWTIKPFTQKTFVLPPSNFTEFVSIEPSDGGGYLSNTQRTGKPELSVSDQVYGAANITAQKLDLLFPKNPNIGVNLYAYSSHAAPPSFKLHPRVFVQLIPYQFQNIAFGPSFIKLWASKVQRFGLYDYYNYPDAQYDLPGGLSIDEAMKRLIHSVRNGSEGTNYETSYSKFATGIPLWIISRYMADGNAQWEKNLDQLTKDLFENSSAKMLDLFTLFYRQPNFGPQYMGNAVKLLQEASSQSVDAKVQMRLTELKLYLQYANLVYQSRDVTKGGLQQRLLPLTEFAWKLYPAKIVHSYRIMQLVSYSFLNTDKSDKNHSYYQKLHADWFPETARSKASWNRITQTITANEVEKDFKSLLTQYKPATIPANYNPKELFSLIDASGLRPNTSLIFAGNQHNRGYFGVFAERPTTISIKYRITGPAPKLTISSIDKNYAHDTAISITTNAGNLQLKLPAGETTLFLNAGDKSVYRIQADLKDGLYFFDGSPRGKMAFYNSFTAPDDQYTYNTEFYPSHIYMPGNVGSVNYMVQVNALTITSTSNNKISTELVSIEATGFEYRKFSVQPNQRGNIWKAEVSGNFNYSFLNIPDRYFLLKKK